MPIRTPEQQSALKGAVRRHIIFLGAFQQRGFPPLPPAILDEFGSLAYGITYAAVLERLPGNERLVMVLFGEDKSTFQRLLRLATRWSRQHATAGSSEAGPDSRTLATPASLETAIAAFTLRRQFTDEVVAAFLGVRVRSLARLGARGCEWFFTEAAKQAPGTA